MTSYRIDSEDGTEVACGIQTASSAAYRARELARQTGETYYWGEDAADAEQTAVAPEQVQCECSCGCSEPATQRCESEHVCDECSNYYTTADGEVVCSREQDTGGCRHCSEAIVWGPIQTGQPGVANWRDGRCSCRKWTETERGGQWELREREVRQ